MSFVLTASAAQHRDKIRDRAVAHAVLGAHALSELVQVHGAQAVQERAWAAIHRGLHDGGRNAREAARHSAARQVAEAAEEALIVTRRESSIELLRLLVVGKSGIDTSGRVRWMNLAHSAQNGTLKRQTTTPLTLSKTVTFSNSSKWYAVSSCYW